MRSLSGSSSLVVVGDSPVCRLGASIHSLWARLPVCRTVPYRSVPCRGAVPCRAVPGTYKRIEVLWWVAILLGVVAWWFM